MTSYTQNLYWGFTSSWWAKHQGRMEKDKRSLRSTPTTCFWVVLPPAPAARFWFTWGYTRSVLRRSRGVSLTVCTGWDRRRWWQSPQEARMRLTSLHLVQFRIPYFRCYSFVWLGEWSGVESTSILLVSRLGASSMFREIILTTRIGPCSSPGAAFHWPHTW